MKRLFWTLTLLVLTFVHAFSIDDTTQFLGIPVDGSKADMIRQLKSKGYEYNEGEDYLTGFYFGDPVYVFVQTVNDKVARIIVYDIVQRNEPEIKYRFNTIYNRFSKSNRFTRLGKKDVILTDKFNLLYEIRQHKYVHKAIFRQISSEISEEEIERACAPAVSANSVDLEALKFDYKERRRRIHAKAIGYVNQHNKESYPSQVWFVISERFGKFGMVLLYDNVPNLLKERSTPRF